MRRKQRQNCQLTALSDPSTSPSLSPALGLSMATRTAILASPAKPLLRGVSHQISFFCALAACAALVMRATPGTATAAAFVFSASLVNLFGTSAL